MCKKILRVSVTAQNARRRKPTPTTVFGALPGRGLAACRRRPPPGWWCSSTWSRIGNRRDATCSLLFPRTWRWRIAARSRRSPPACRCCAAWPGPSRWGSLENSTVRFAAKRRFTLMEVVSGVWRRWNRSVEEQKQKQRDQCEQGYGGDRHVRIIK